MTDVASRFNLTKAEETLDRFLLQKGLRTAPTLRASLAVDISGSMQSIFARGDAQRTVNQTVPVALKFDDNGELELFKFDDRCEYVGVVTRDNFETFLRDNRVSPRGGTNYAPIVRTTLNHFFGGTEPGSKGGLFSKAKPSGEPTLVQIVTDGECSDAREAEKAFVDAQAYNIYYQFIAVGKANFRTIKHLSDKLPNVGDVYLRDFGMTEDQVYAQVVSDELVSWLKKN